MSNLIIRDLVAPEQPVSSYETKMIVGGFGEGDPTKCDDCNIPLDAETSNGGSSKDGNNPATDQGQDTFFIGIRVDTEFIPVKPTK